MIFIFQTQAQQWNEIIKAVATDRDSVDWFGISGSISGNYAIIGAMGEDDDVAGRANYSNSGSAYIFEKNEYGHWIQKQKLKASDRDIEDYFGWSVAISGNYAVVGAVFEDEDVFGADSLSSAGSAYIFERDNMGVWAEVQKIVAADREIQDFFGYSVDISGSTLIVGAVYEDENQNLTASASNAGSAYIFERNGIGNWVQVQKIVQSDRMNDDRFGFTAHIHNDILIVGAIGQDYDTSGNSSKLFAGAAYIFEKDGLGVWNETQKIVASDREQFDYFGYSVDIIENWAIVGAYHENEDSLGGNTLDNSGSAYVFEKDSLGTWSEKQKVTAGERAVDDLFGYTVAISENFIAVGAKNEDEDAFETNTQDDAGSAYIFKKNNLGVWNFDKKIVASDRAANDAFGAFVDISENDILIGAYLEDEDISGVDFLSASGSAYIYNTCATIEYDTESICEGDSIFLEGNYQTVAGEYYTNFISTGGCDSTVIVNLSFNPVFEFTENVSICDGDSILVAGVFQSTAGTYPVLYNTILGCDSIVNTELNIYPVPIIAYNVFPDSNNLGNIDLSISGGSSPYYFEWSNGETVEDISELQSGEYSVTVYNIYGCASTELISVPLYDYIQDYTISELKVLPNPTEGIFTIQNISGSMIFIYNPLGELLETYLSEKPVVNFDISHYKNGLYFIKAVNENMVFTAKLLLEK